MTTSAQRAGGLFLKRTPLYYVRMQAPPGVRVVPKNLFLSAQRALSDNAVHAKSVTKSNLRDLCTLLSLSVLYDEVETLGNKGEFDEGSKPYIAPEYKSIQELTGLKIRVGPSPEEFDSVLRKSISFAVEPFSNAGKNIDIDRLKIEIGTSLREGVSTIPDDWKDFAEGEKLLLNHGLEDKRSGAERFWLRSFLYAGLAASRRRSLVPDTVRSWGLPDLIGARPDYARALETAIEHKYPPDKVRALLLDSAVPVPPFAAGIFIRAGNSRHKIAHELKALREELTPVRTALQSFQLENEIGDYRGFITVFGKAHTADSKMAVDDRVADAVEALRIAKLPIPPQLVALKPVFDAVWSSASLFINLVSASPKAIKAAKDLLALALQVQDVRSAGDRTAFLEVHYRLGWDLREWFNHGVRIEDMFGPIQDDEPIRRPL